MNYIVFDLEWNQCPYGKGQENERIPFEIIEIGAVKLNSERQIIDQYQVLIQPRVYKKLHHRTREIIQMDMKLLEREGIPFYRAVKEFLNGAVRMPFCSWAIPICWNCSEHEILRHPAAFKRTDPLSGCAKIIQYRPGGRRQQKVSGICRGCTGDRKTAGISPGTGGFLVYGKGFDAAPKRDCGHVLFH